MEQNTSTELFGYSFHQMYSKHGPPQTPLQTPNPEFAKIFPDLLAIILTVLGSSNWTSELRMEEWFIHAELVTQLIMQFSNELNTRAWFFSFCSLVLLGK